MATSNVNTRERRVPSAQQKIDFKAIFPRLRLVSCCCVYGRERDYGYITVAGSDRDLLDAKILTQVMIDSMPRCGTKYFRCHYPGGAGFCCDVKRIRCGFRVRASINEEDLLGVAGQLREILGIKTRAEREAVDRFRMAEIMIQTCEDCFARDGMPADVTAALGTHLREMRDILNTGAARATRDARVISRRSGLRLVVNNRAEVAHV